MKSQDNHRGNGAVARTSQPRVALDEATRQEICGMMRLGFRRRVAAAYAGCSDHEVFQESERDASFRRQLRHAAREAEARLLKCIALAGEKHWQAAAWALERLHPERYSKRAPDTVTGEQLQYAIGQLVDIVYEQVPETDRRRAIEQRVSHLFGESSGSASAPGTADRPAGENNPS